jgi:hypothetical protein
MSQTPDAGLSPFNSRRCNRQVMTMTEPSVPEDATLDHELEREKKKDDENASQAGRSQRIGSIATLPNDETPVSATTTFSTLMQKFRAQTKKAAPNVDPSTPTPRSTRIQFDASASRRPSTAVQFDPSTSRRPSTAATTVFQERRKSLAAQYRSRESVGSIAVPVSPRGGQLAYRRIFPASFRHVAEGLWNMVVFYPYWDMSFWS